MAFLKLDTAFRDYIIIKNIHPNFIENYLIKFQNKIVSTKWLEYVKINFFVNKYAFDIKATLLIIHEDDNEKMMYTVINY